eukprot:scaffold53372_cov52-Attheya_sp.AAC.8
MGNEDVSIALGMHNNNNNMTKGNAIGDTTIESDSEQGANVCPNCASSLGRQQRRLDEPFLLKQQRDESVVDNPVVRKSPSKRRFSSSFLCCGPMLAIDEGPQDDYDECHDNNDDDDPTMSSILDESKAPAIHQLQAAEAHQQQQQQEQQKEQAQQVADADVPFCVNCQAHVISRQLEMDRLLHAHGGDKEVLSMLFRQGRILLATTTTSTTDHNNNDDVRDEKESYISLSSVPNQTENTANLINFDSHKQEGEPREFRGAGETSTYSSNSNNNNNNSGPSLVDDSESDDDKDGDNEHHDAKTKSAHNNNNNHVDDTTTDNQCSPEEDTGDISSLEEDHESNNHDDDHYHENLVQAPTDECSATNAYIHEAPGKNSPIMEYSARYVTCMYAPK